MNHDENIKYTLKQMPEYISIQEVYSELAGSFGDFNNSFCRRYSISEVTLRKYIKKYCVYVSKGVWRKKNEV